MQRLTLHCFSRERRPSFFSFITNACAILGYVCAAARLSARLSSAHSLVVRLHSGVFTMFSILDGCMYQSQQALLGKQD